MHVFRDKRGVTLVELVVVTGLFAVVGGLAVAFFLSVITGRARSLARIETQEQARVAMQRMVYEIRRARGIEGTSDFDVNLAVVPGSTLDLDMEDIARDPTTFLVASGVLRMSQAGGSAVDLTTADVTVSDLTFSDYSTANGLSQNIGVSLTIEHVDPTGGDAPFSYSLRSTVELRDE